MKLSSASRAFEAITPHHFERMLPQGGTIRREQDVGVALSDFQRFEKELLKVAFHMERLAAVRSRKCGRIENNDVEFFSAPRQSRQHPQHVLGDELMIICRQIVERKILLAARQRFF